MSQSSTPSVEALPALAQKDPTFYPQFFDPGPSEEAARVCPSASLGSATQNLKLALQHLGASQADTLPVALALAFPSDVAAAERAETSKVQQICPAKRFPEMPRQTGKHHQCGPLTGCLALKAPAHVITCAFGLQDKECVSIVHIINLAVPQSF